MKKFFELPLRRTPMRRIMGVFSGLLAAAVLTAGCSDKLASESCVLCEAAATQNYTSPQKTEVTISMKGGKKYELRPGETVSACDQHYGVVEMMVGKSK